MWDLCEASRQMTCRYLDSPAQPFSCSHLRPTWALSTGWPCLHFLHPHVLSASSTELLSVFSNLSHHSPTVSLASLVKSRGIFRWRNTCGLPWRQFDLGYLLCLNEMEYLVCSICTQRWERSFSLAFLNPIMQHLLSLFALSVYVYCTLCCAFNLYVLSTNSSSSGATLSLPSVALKSLIMINLQSFTKGPSWLSHLYRSSHIDFISDLIHVIGSSWVGSYRKYVLIVKPDVDTNSIYSNHYT